MPASLRHSPGRSMRWVGCFFLLMLAWGGFAAAAPPNIVLIVADDLGWAGVGYHNALMLTPNIDRLADEGIRLENFYVSPICSPTRAGLLTGRWPIRFGIMATQVRHTDDYGIDADEITLPEMLADAGYRRRALVGKWHLGESRPEYHPLQQGFTSFYGCLGAMVNNWTHQSFTRPPQVDWWRDEAVAKDEGHVTELVTDEAVRFIEENADESPFFLMLSYNAPHTPLTPMKQDREPYTHAPLGMRSYAAVVTGMDRGIGRVLSALDSTGVRDDTLVLFLSDNGAETQLMNEPLRGEKRELYDGAIRVPAVAHWPAGGVGGGRTVPDRVGYIDIFPTLKSAAEDASPNSMPLDGVDVLEVLRGETSLEQRDWYNYVDFRGEGPGIRMALSAERWKLIYEGPDFVDNVVITIESMELYDILDDPFERRDRVTEHPEIAFEMLGRLRAFRALEPEGALH